MLSSIVDPLTEAKRSGDRRKGERNSSSKSLVNRDADCCAELNSTLSSEGWKNFHNFQRRWVGEWLRANGDLALVLPPASQELQGETLRHYDSSSPIERMSTVLGAKLDCCFRPRRASIKI